MKKLVRYIRVRSIEGIEFLSVVCPDGELDRGFQREAELDEYVKWLKMCGVKVIDERGK